MKFTKLVVLTTALTLHGINTASAKKSGKCPICHWSKEDKNESNGHWHTLKVSCNAKDAHIAHGDLDGSCDTQACKDLCHHQSCMDDYFENQDSGECSCHIDAGVAAQATQCGVGATCDMVLDECVCNDDSQVFDENRNCISPCSGNSINVRMEFHHAEPSDYFDSSYDSDWEVGLNTLRAAYPDLFALEGQECWLNITGLETLATPDPSRDRSLYFEQAMGWNPDNQNFDRCYVSGTEKTYFTPEGYYPTVATDCSEANEFFQSLVSARNVYTTDFDGGYIDGGSDLHRFELITTNLFFDEPCHTYLKDYATGEAFYQAIAVSFSMSASATVVFGGGRGLLRGGRNTQEQTEFDPVWLANGNSLSATYIPFDEFGVDTSDNGIHFPFVSDHHLTHNQAKNWVNEIQNYPDDSFINAKRWVAKMYGHPLLPSVKTYSSTYKYVPFKLLADFKDIVIKACT